LDFQLLISKLDNNSLNKIHNKCECFINNQNIHPNQNVPLSFIKQLSELIKIGSIHLSSYLRFRDYLFEIRIFTVISFPYLSQAFSNHKTLKMKRLLVISVIFLCSTFISLAQTPQKFNYQAVARDNTGAIIKNQNISLRISIRSGSTSGVNEYVETFSVTTNDFGLMNLEIGGGTPVIGNMVNIDWGKTTYFIAVEMDASGGTNYQLMGVSQLLSVPYALYAEKSGGGNDGDTSSTNEIQTLSRTGNTVYLSKAGGNFIDQVNYDDADSLNELQNLSISDHELTISKGNTITLPDNINDADADSTNELQSISISHDTIFLSKGQSIKLSKTHGDFSQGGEAEGFDRRFGNTDNYSLNIITNDTTRVHIQNDGKVGFGTTSPREQLEITGNLRLPNTTSSSGVIYVNGSRFIHSRGSNNTFVGINSGSLSTNSDYATGFGYSALNSITSGTHISAFGSFALTSNTIGAHNTAIGTAALFYNTTGSRNTACGHYSLYYNTTGSYNTAIGTYTGSTDTNLSNTVSVGYQTKATADNRVHIGNGSIAWIGGQVSWSSYSDARFKKNINENVAGLDFILKLRPVTYQWDIEMFDKFLGIPDSIFNDEILTQARKNKESIVYTGFLAQDVEKAALDVDFNFSGIQSPANENTPYSLSYGEFVVPLVKAVQEQQKTIQEQKNEINLLKARLLLIEEKIDKIQY
jgi:hypothetical protein